MSASARTSRVLTLAVLLCLILAVFVTYSHPPAQFMPWSHSNRPESWQPLPHASLLETSPDVDPACPAHRGSDNIAIAVKTGATEAVEKVPILMLTALRCAQYVKIFSDLEQDIAGYHLHDALRGIPESVMEGNSDFDFYWRLKEAERYGEIETMLREAKDPRIPQDLAAWTLDKYKQLHILEGLYETYPDKDWYMMIDADTYVVWSNLLTWLQQLPDPSSNKLYLGSPAQVAGRHFAHGGSGILLSKAAMHEFAVTNKGIAASWDEKMHEECCGDLIIGDVLKEEGIPLKPAWPTINGEKPITLPFGPTHWCQPVVTMHHVHPNDMNQITNLELSRNQTQGPLIFADLFEAFTKDVIPDDLIDWDNYPNDIITELQSFEACQEACQQDEKCFQFNHHGSDCILGYSVHLGEPKSPEGDMIWRSGWLRDRIRSWVDAQAPCQSEFPWT